MCETLGSMMNQHCGKSRHLEPEFFCMEMFLRVNLGPLHLLESLVDEILSNDFNKSYLRKETRISQIVSKGINKSTAIATFHKINEKKSRFPMSFWLISPNQLQYVTETVCYVFRLSHYLVYF